MYLKLILIQNLLSIKNKNYLFFIIKLSFKILYKFFNIVLNIWLNIKFS